jgi:hypothetical protein
VTAPGSTHRGDVDAIDVRDRVVEALKSANLWDLCGSTVEREPGDIVSVMWMERSEKWHITVYRFTYRTTAEQRDAIRAVLGTLGLDVLDNVCTCTLVIPPGPLAGYPRRAFGAAVHEIAPEES